MPSQARGKRVNERRERLAEQCRERKLSVPTSKKGQPSVTKMLAVLRDARRAPQSREAAKWEPELVRNKHKAKR